MISATEVAINKEDKNICVNFLIFSAELGIARINSALHSLARKFVKFVGNKILWLNKFVQNYNEKATHSRHRADLLADNANYHANSFSFQQDIFSFLPDNFSFPIRYFLLQSL